MSDSEAAETTTEWLAPDFGEQVFKSFWKTTFGPELERRRKAGLVGASYVPHMVQWLIPPDGNGQILFDQEVRTHVQLRLERDLIVGEQVRIDNIDIVDKIELLDGDLDCGHVTFIRIGSRWKGTFNFTYGRAKARVILERAAQFLDASRFSYRKQHVGPAVENLFAAAELASRAELTLDLSSALKSRTHATTASAINLVARRGNIDPAFVSLFNRLGQQRGDARYGDSDNTPPMPPPEAFDLVGELIERTLKRVARKTDRQLMPEVTDRDEIL